jgi:hypothetical protein
MSPAGDDLSPAGLKPGTARALHIGPIQQPAKEGTMSTCHIEDDRLSAVQGGMNTQLWNAMQHAVGMGLNVHWIESGPHYPNSRHWVGRAFDVGGSPNKLQQFFDWAKGTHPHELIYKNTFLRDGRPVNPIGGHETHVHYSV